jgi:hypothetical protein
VVVVVVFFDVVDVVLGVVVVVFGLRFSTASGVRSTRSDRFFFEGSSAVRVVVVVAVSVSVEVVVSVVVLQISVSTGVSHTKVLRVYLHGT